jgi:hypothetical protein
MSLLGHIKWMEGPARGPEVQSSGGCLNQATTSRTCGTGEPLHRSAEHGGQFPSQTLSLDVCLTMPSKSRLLETPLPRIDHQSRGPGPLSNGSCWPIGRRPSGQLRAVRVKMQRSAHGEFTTSNAVRFALLGVARLPRRTYSIQTREGCGSELVLHEWAQIPVKQTGPVLDFFSDLSLPWAVSQWQLTARSS